MKKVSDHLAQFLKDKEIKHVFGIIGSGNAHIFDSINRLGYTEIVCVHHEQAAVMAMGTYFRTSGKISAALVTTGGGTTNAMTGVVSCWMDSVPGLIIAGNENSRFTSEENKLRIWGIQGLDSVKMYSGVTKSSVRLLKPEGIIEELERAYWIAGDQRPGPTWLEIPMNIQAAPVDTEKLSRFDNPSPHETSENLSTYTRKLIQELKKSSRPVLWLGHGIRLSGAVGLIEQLLELSNIPALVSWAGIDMLDAKHKLNFGRAGIYGQRASNFVLQNSDFVLSIGNRMAIPQIGYDVSELCRDAKIAVVDIDPLEVEKLGPKINLPLCADAKDFITELIQQLRAENSFPKYEAWFSACSNYRQKYPVVGPEHADKDGFINSYPFMEKLSHYLKKDSIVVTDMGTALLSGHQVLPIKKGQRLMTSTGLGEMGYGISAALGVSFATNHGEVICLNCDGGMMMNLQELQTIAHHQLPIKIFVFNNDGYLMIKHTQKALFKGNYSGTDRKSGVSCPDFSRLADAFGFKNYRIRSWSDFSQVIPMAMNEKGPTIIEVFMHPEQLFVPKLSLAPQPDGSIISPPLEDLTPFIPRAELEANMIVGVHEKSKKIQT